MFLSHPLLQLVGSTLLALVPAILWGIVFYYKQPEGRRITLLTFFAGAIAVVPLLAYRYLWNYFPWLNAFEYLQDRFAVDFVGIGNFIRVPLSIVVTFMLVGVIEEIMKLLAMVFTDKDRIKSVDDAMELAIMAALGFSFAENILYFYNIWKLHGPGDLLFPFLFRSSFSTCAHLLFSGMFGYYYGLAHFAKPILQEEVHKKSFVWERYICRAIKCRPFTFFHEEKMFQGFLIAAVMHAVFNIFLEMNWTFLIVPYLLIGYTFLSYLFSKKENHKRYDLLLVGSRNH